MENIRVAGAVSIGMRMGSWNAGFDGRPRALSDAQMFASDKALKYAVRDALTNMGEKVLYRRSKCFEKGNLVPMGLDARTMLLSGIQDQKEFSELKKDNKAFLTKLFECEDVRLFGATYASKEVNFGITGPAQIGFGLEVTDAEELEVEVLSPFPNSAKAEKNGETDRQNTMGNRVITPEAHYFYPVSVNSRATAEYSELLGTECFNAGDEAKFESALMHGATDLASCTKLGAVAEFGIFAELKGNASVPDMTRYLSIEKENGSRVRITFDSAAFCERYENRIGEVRIYADTESTDVAFTGRQFAVTDASEI